MVGVALPEFVQVSSNLEGRLDRNGNPLVLANGFLPFQAEGLNFMSEQERCVYYQWSTGTGKTLAAEGTILWRKEENPFDLCLYVVKPNNILNTETKLRDHTKLGSHRLAGSPSRRDKILAEVDVAIDRGNQPIMIFNAEKFTEDKEILQILVENRNVLIILDEIAAKYSNRNSGLYRNTCEVLYTSWAWNQYQTKRLFYPRKGYDRTASSFFVGMSATPIITSPEGAYNQIRLMDSSVLGSVTDFENMYVQDKDWYDNIVSWKNLQHLKETIQTITHSADKRQDPAIAIQFPVRMPDETVECELLPNERKLYQLLQKEYSNIGEASILDRQEILAAIGCLKMLCSNPRSVMLSAEARWVYEQEFEEFLKSRPTPKEVKEYERRNRKGSLVALKFVELVENDDLFTDKDKKGNPTVAKLIELQDQIAKHDDKMIIFTSLNELGLPFLSEWLTEWGYDHVTYHGGLTSLKAKQEAIDGFRYDPDKRIFLSTDAGQDSIDLPEANLTIHYDSPRNDSDAGVVQRDNRMDRIDSEMESIRSLLLMASGTIEVRQQQIREKKRGFHEAVYGMTEMTDEIEADPRSDLLYLLTGEWIEDQQSG